MTRNKKIGILFEKSKRRVEFMKWLIGCIVICGLSTQLLCLEYVPNSRDKHKNEVGKIVYKLPEFLRDLSHYTQISYELRPVDQTITLNSRLVVKKLGTEEVSTWNLGGGSFALFGDEKSLGTNVLELGVEIVSSRDIRDQEMYLAFYLNGTIFGGWALDKAYWNAGKGIDSSLSTEITIPISELSSIEIGDIACDGKVIQVGDFIHQTPVISARIYDGVSGIKSWGLRIINDRTNHVVAEKWVSLNVIATQSVTALFETVPPLTKGVYAIEVRAVNGSDEAYVVTSNQVVYRSDLELKELIVGPTPYNPNQTKLGMEYQLSEDADVRLYIYGIDGELQWEWQAHQGQQGGTVGFNRLEWDGINRFGEKSANGFYIVYAEAKNGSEISRKKTKIIITK